MLLLAREEYLLSALLIIWLAAPVVNTSSQNSKRYFVTTTENKTLAIIEDNQDQEQQILWDDNFNYEDYYNLRFRPARLFWQKFKPQLEEPTTTTTPEPTEEPEPETTTTMMTTTTTTTTTAVPPPPPKRPTTTRTSIMRPLTPSSYLPHFANRIKQLLLYGSPIQANLIQKIQSNAPTIAATANSTIKTKSKGFLSLFEVIKFPNSKCTVSMGDIRSMEGVCYHDFECKSLGGISTERCAEGVGVCCIFLTGCGDLTNQPVVYFESPNYPNAVREMMICVLIVNIRKGIQQLRLDFLMFELNRPTNGDCTDDQFIVSGQNANFQIPVLCGINTGQHMYVHVGDSFEKKIYLSIFVKVPTGGRSFNIKITQLEDNLAPNNCLQYYTEPEGTLKSFNYDMDGIIVTEREATYLNNLNYVMCIARAKNMCSVNYVLEQMNGESLDFQIINKDEAENDLVGDGQAGAGIFNCPDDFISVNSVRLCGERFNDGTDNEDYTAHAPVRDTAAGPIMLPFRTDAEYVGRGFRLLYKQELCA